MSQGKQQKGGQGQNRGGQGGQGKSQGQGGRGGAQGGQGKGQGQGGQGARREPKKENPSVPGMIWAVPSGDSVVIIPLEADSQGPIKDINFTLTGLKAPVLGKKTQSGVTQDQPYAWESREFLRALLIGKPVVYKIEHELEGGVRAYGDLWLNQENVREKIVSNGWADVSVRERKPAIGQDGKELPPREPRPDEVLLTKLSEEAKKLKKGMWKNAPNSQPALKTVRQITYHDAATRRDEADASAALFSFFERNRGQSLNGVVEQVRSGSSLRIYFPATHDEVTVNLSGVLAPVYRFGDEAASQPFSREAKFFTEAKLLNRDVLVTLETLDKTNNLFGTVLDTEKERNIASHLLTQGLASFVEWNCPVEKAKEWQALEEKAKASRARLWAKPAVAKTATTTTTSTTASTPANVSAGNITEDQFTGTVVEVVGAGSIVVRVAKPDGSFVDVTTSFSSVRVPRLPPKKKEEAEGEKPEGEEEETPTPVVVNSVVGNKGKGDAKLTAQEAEKIEAAYAREAKDFLRKELIGKRVNCVKDYVDEGSKKQAGNKSGRAPARPPRVMYSVYVGKSNVALKLLRKGYARASFLSESDPRSVDYKDMVLAEKQAEKERVGLHGPSSKAPVIVVNDLSFEGEAKCRHFLGSLQRIGRVPAVVEYNFGPGRFKVYIPSQGLTISFALKGILSEKPVKAKLPPGTPANFRKQHPLKDEEGNPIAANAALHYTRDTLFQRDVNISIEDLDAQGTFFGSLFFGNENFAQKLVELGYGKLHHKSAERLPNYEALKKAEEASKSAKRGLWVNYDAAAEEARLTKLRADRQAARGAATAGDSKVVANKKFLVTVTEIMTGSNFFFQIADEETKTFMEDLMEDFQNRGWQEKAVYVPQKKGEWVAGKFTADNTWYRAQVLRVIPAATESEEKTYELRYLDYGNSEIVTKDNIRELDPEFSKTPAQAHKGKLAYIKAPHLDAEFGDDAAIFFKELVWGKTLQANQQYQDDNVYHVILGDDDGQVDIGGALVMQGLASLEAKRKLISVNEKYYTELQAQEQTARTARLRIWQYGVVPDSDEERQWANMLR